MHSATASTASSSSSSSSSGTSGSADDVPAALPINQPDGKLYSRLLSRQALSSSIAAAPAPSFRVYYSVAPGSVPFLWEASPGTPKHAAAGDYDTASAIPPLTPPPSYLSSPKTAGNRRQQRYSKAAGLLTSILPRSGSVRRRNRMPSSTASLCQSASTSSSSSAYESPRRAAACCHDDDEDADDGVPVKTSAFCFQVASRRRSYCCNASNGSR